MPQLMLGVPRKEADGMSSGSKEHRHLVGACEPFPSSLRDPASIQDR